MLKSLGLVNQGLVSPQAFQKAELTRRTLNMALSAVAVVQPCFMSAVNSLDVDSTGRFLLSGTSNGTWLVHDTFNFSGRPEHMKRCTLTGLTGVNLKAISTVEWYPQNQGSGLFVTSSMDGKLCLWDTNNATEPVDKYRFEEPVTRHHINPYTGTTIAACTDGNVTLVDLRSGTSIQKLPETLTKSKEMRWNPRNEHEIIVGSTEGHLIEWDVRSTLNYRGYGQLEVVVARRGVRTRDFKEQVSLLQKAHDGPIFSIRFDSSGLEFYSMGDGVVRRWGTDLPASKEPLISALIFGRKSKSLWNYQMGIATGTDPPILFAPTENLISVCDMKQCVVRKQLAGHCKDVNCVVYDPVSQQCYSGGQDMQVMLWSGHLTTDQTYNDAKSEDPKNTRVRPDDDFITETFTWEETPFYDDEYELVDSVSSEEFDFS